MIGSEVLIVCVTECATNQQKKRMLMAQEGLLHVAFHQKDQ